ncbi:fibronectin type III domain-containing protein [Actinokineospora cianjurensis]|uniref:Fibronectin type III domain protein n=1 Tax=Actinokineospora cianjurensis TaxID=585224 RepID=A0A421B9E7_9PSEU|nr:fibronectin type III domain-containing protein [Actinokineospora cianjurensis]RLK60928.1 fibronectin type III domain protein [Actinokineospora cianjurensis]
MKFGSRGSRLATAAAVASLVVTGVLVGSGTGTASPREITLDYTCPFPLIGTQQVKVTIKGDIPTEMPVGTPSPEFVIDTVSNAGPTATQGMNLIGAVTIEGSATANTELVMPGLTLPLQVPATVPLQPVPPTGQDFIVNATGQAPSITAPRVGVVQIFIRDLVLRLTPKKPDGTAPLGTFDSACTQVPGQNTLFADITVVDAEDTEAPTAPAGLAVTGVTQSSVALSWNASADNKGVTGYDVYRGTTLAKTVTGTAATVDGLAANTEYSFTVKARDAAGNASAASDAVTARTSAAPDTAAPSAPTGLRSTGSSQSSVGLAWEAATDNVGVVGYDVYRGTTLAKSVTETTATIDGLTADTEYSFTVKARDAAGNVSAAGAAVTARTTAAPDTQAPSAPTNLSVTGTTQSSVSLEWTAAGDNVGVTGYDVYRGTTLAKSVTGTTATVDGLSPDTEYSFTVKARDAAGNVSPASAAATARTEAAPDTAAPTAPGNLRATTVTQTSVALAWDAAADNVGVTGYEVFQGTTSVATTSGTTATINGLVADTPYTVTVKAHDAAGNVSPASAALAVRTKPAPDTTAPTAPANLRSTGVTQTSVNLAWNAATDNVGVAGYEVFEGATSVATSTGTSATITGLTADTEHTYTVKARDAAGNVSPASAALKVRTQQAPDTAAPTAPGSLRSTGVTQTSISLAWNAATDNVGVTGYEVFQGTASVATSSGTTATINGLTADTSYTFTVKARDAAGNVSPASAALTVRTQSSSDTAAPSAPGNLRSTGVTDTSATLAWDAATDNVGVVGYDLYRGTTLATSVTGTTATVSGLTADTSYTFTVKARDAAGNVSPASAAVTVLTKPTTGPPVIKYGYELTGTGTLRALDGRLDLRGGIDAQVVLTTGAVDAKLTLNPTTGRFRLWGLLPVTAQVRFEQVGSTTGTLSGGALTTTSTVIVKLPRVSVLGFPISANPGCQTKSPAVIPLASKPGFDPIRGGKLAGTYTLPALQGCGPLTPLLSGLIAGPGNTLEITLKPRT